MLAAAVILAAYFIAPGYDGGSAPRGGVGPTTWPRAMLLGIAFCSAALLLRELFCIVARQRSPASADGGSAGFYDNRKAAIGIAILILYGAAIPVTGFALATLAFLAIWLWLGGVHKALTICLVSTVGTVVLLYIFVKVSTLPLNRGIGPFDGLTVSLYRALGIY